MLNRRPSFTFSRNGWSPDAMAMVRNHCLALLVGVVLVLTIIAATYRTEDPWLHPSARITAFLGSRTNTTVKSGTTAVRTGENFVAPAIAAVTGATDLDSSELEPKFAPLESEVVNPASENGKCEIDAPIDCSDVDVFRVLMRSAIEAFSNLNFYRFGKPVRGENHTSCHMAWKFRYKERNGGEFHKDYRSFTVIRSENCTISVVGIGDFHSGVNARKRRGEEMDEQNKSMVKMEGEDGITLALPQAVNDSSFSQAKYLLYSGGGDRCKSMHQYLWSFMCMLGEARFLNRTLVMDMTICLPKMYTASGNDEDGKDFRLYFDFEHLLDSMPVMELDKFWMEWTKWQKKDGLSLHFVDDIKVTPMQLARVEDALIMRKFGSIEPANYWYQVCQGDAGSVIERPWRTLWKSRPLLDISGAIAARMNWDYDAVHIIRGDKARNKALWPNLDRDTSPAALLSSLKHKVNDGRNLYIATNEPNASFFDPLKESYPTHFLDQHADLWDSNSDWHAEATKLSRGKAVEFDGYMRLNVDTEVFLRGRKQIETFNDLTKDCKDGVNSCTPKI